MNHDRKKLTIQLDAETIVAHAQHFNAERIVFRTPDSHFFSSPELKQISHVIEEADPPRYKLQKKHDEKWEDITKYRLVSHAADALESLKNGDINIALRWHSEDIARAANQNKVDFHNTLRVVLRSIIAGPEKWRSGSKLESTRRLLESIRELISDPYLDYALATTRLYEDISGLSFKIFPDSGTVQQFISRVEKTLAVDTGIFETNAGRLAADMTLAKLYSLYDRKVSAKYFAKVRGRENSDIVKYFFVDTGSFTYFCSSDFSLECGEDAGLIRESISFLDVSEPRGDSAILMSVDPHFFRIYSPIIYFYAQQLPNVDLNIVLCGDEEDVLSLVEQADSYQEELSSLNGIEKPQNIHLFRMPVPSFVVEESTFFASARFFAINAMLQRYGQIYIMDADLVTDVDPRPFLDAVKDLIFSVPETHTFHALAPWRRFMAGNMAINKNVFQTDIVSEMQEYLAYGFRFKNSWMLDQNALAYVIEKNREYFEDLGRHGRPFKQPKFRSVWEARYWKLSAHAPRK